MEKETPTRTPRRRIGGGGGGRGGVVGGNGSSYENSDRSVTSSATAGSTPSKVLADKLDRLDRSWTEHKALSPLVPASKTKPRLTSSTTSLTGVVATAATAADASQGQLDHDHESESVGSGSVSTLSSTESVVEKRLHRQGGRSSPNITTERKASAKSFSSLASAKKNKINSSSSSSSSNHNPRRKDRFRAYQQGAASETRSLGGGGGERYDGRIRGGHETPRRRTRPGGSLCGNETTSSLASSTVHYTDGGNTNPYSTFHRLYRNEKREEKLWKEPVQFSPTLKNRDGHHQEQEDEEEDDDNDDDFDVNHLGPSPVPLKTVVSTTMEEDLEAILELGRQLGDDHDNFTMPFGTTTSISTTEEDTRDSPQRRQDWRDGGIQANPTTTLEDDVHALELLGKELDAMEADRSRFSSSVNSEKPVGNFIENSPIDKQNPSSGDTHTDSTANDTYGFFTLDQPSRSYFFAERVDRISSPFHRRNRHQDTQIGYSCDDERLLTPRRIRDASCVTIQSRWRIHLAELAMATKIISSWSVCFSVMSSCRLPSLNLRRAALDQAVKVVPCWWILEGFCVEGNWINVTWENEVSVGNSRLQVHAACDAEAPTALSTVWTERKLCILLVKVALTKAFRGECAADKVAKWYHLHKGKLNQKASMLQRWWLRQRHELLTAGIPTSDVSTAQVHGLIDASRPLLELDETTLLDSNNGDNAVSSPEELRPSVGSGPSERAAAVTIQSWFRVLTLKSAIKTVPLASHQIRSVLHSAGVSSPSSHTSQDEDLRSVQQLILRNSVAAKRLQADQFSWIGDYDASPNFIAQRAATLAIQNIVRAYVAGLTIFRRKKKAILIQAHFRGYLARRKVEELHFAAVLIQFAWSNHRYLNFQNENAVVIQQFWRKTLYQAEYRMTRFCVMLLQSSWRRAIVRRRFTSSIESATSVQSAWRTFCERRRYLIVRSAIMSLQHLVRRRLNVALYQKEVQHATSMQSAWRMRVARTNLLQSIRAAELFQSLIRRSLELRRFRIARSRAVLIQTSWRRFCQRNAYQVRVQSAIYIQQRWRAFLGRQQFLGIYAATIRIQATFRMAHFRSVYVSNLRSILLAQSMVRAWIAKTELCGQQKHVANIQRVWRGWTGRREAYIRRMQKVTASSTLIQSWWRSSMHRAKYLKFLRRIVLLETEARRILARRRFEQLLFQRRIRDAAIFIQTLWRASRALHNYRQACVAIVTIQAAWRGVLAVDTYADMVMSRRGRMEVGAAIFIQRVWRGTLKRSHLLSLHVSATTIQSSWRAWHTRCAYLSILSSAIALQSFARGAYASISLRMKRDAVCKIQRTWRISRLVHSREHQMWAQAVQSAILIQSQWRASVRRSRFMFARNGAVVIQANVRARLAVRRYYDLVTQERRRRAWEMSLLQIYHNAAAKIQSKWRMHIVRLSFAVTLSSAVAIQAVARRATARKLAESRRSAVVVIQHFLRGTIVRMYLDRQKRQGLAAAATSIQTKWRSSRCRAIFTTIRIASIAIQAFGRGLIVTRMYSDILLQSQSALHIQRNFRGYQSRVYKRRHQRAILIQCYIRSFLTKKQFHQQHFVSQDDRRGWPGNMENTMSNDDAALLIQSLWRGSIQLERYCHLRIFVISIQAVVRGTLSRLHAVEFVEARGAATLIQTYWRSFIAFTEFTNTRIYIVMIQSMLRGSMVRSQWRFVQYLATERHIMDVAARTIQVSFVLWKMENAVWEMQSLAVLLKRGVRGQLVRSAVYFALKHMNSSIFPTIVGAYDRVVLIKHGVAPILAWNRALSQARFSAAIVIQSYARRMVARNQILSTFGVIFESMLEPNHAAENEPAAILIQRSVRSWYQTRKAKATSIQRIARAYMARMIFQRLCNEYELSRLAIEKLQAITKLQATWRRCIARKKFLETMDASIVIQSSWRSIGARRSFVEMRHAISILQWLIRQKRTHVRYQETLIRRYSGAVRLQALVRGASARRLAVERRLMAFQEEEIVTGILEGAFEVGTHMADGFLAGQQSLSEPCLGRLVYRVQHSMHEAKMATVESASLTKQPVHTAISLPMVRRREAALATEDHGVIDKAVKTTPLRCNKTEEGKVPPPMQLPEAMSTPFDLKAPNDDLGQRFQRIAEHKPNRSLRKGIEQNAQRNREPNRHIREQEVQSNETEDLPEEDLPSFDASSPIPKTDMTGWDWTDEW